VGELCDHDAVELRRAIGAREVSPVELLDSCMARIEAVNPALNAFVATDYERARHAARAAEAAVRRGESLGPLHGLPIGIKDLQETAGLRTTHGSLLYADHLPARDERSVAALRAAGAIVVGKTNTPEFGAGANTTNAVYGPTRNPFDPARICGGSSGGSAVALATGMVPLASGSDTGGSLRTPAAYCGVVGFRPSPGLVPSERRPLGWTVLSVLGPMGRSVADTCLLLSAMAGYDRRDPMSVPTEPSSFRVPPPADPATLRVAFSEDLGFAPVDSGVRATFRACAARFAGLFRSSASRDPDMADADDTFAVIRAAGFLAAHRQHYERSRDKLGPNVAANVEQGLGFSLADLARAHAAQTRIYRAFQELFEEVDVLICPAAAVPPFPVERLYPTHINGEELRGYFHWIAITYGLSLTGHPVAVIPCGLDPTGAPFGIQVCGPRHGDAFTLGVAHALERHLATEPELTRPLPDLARIAR
jgi:Asp-tRNA(Asn)/Glu-tRNA(Gln) amidotransferase A subunit family amidase